ncbi:MAG: fumarylacetoacetate hydrolase family protein [Gammaproteobacteria bacterium]|nr:fumarylacetoacetate hydrolase family protein [Gammaproteobacteria bacterium]
METSKAIEAATALHEDFATAHPNRPFAEEVRPTSIDDAYAIQEQFLALREADGDVLSGYKLAYTTATMQNRSGLKEPALGRIFEHTIHTGVATLNASDYVRVGLECEIAVRLSDPLTADGGPYDRDKVSQAVGSVMAAIEIIDSRAPEDMADDERALMGVSANIWNAGIVLGPQITRWREIDLESVHGSVHVNHELAGEGYGRDVMGHPLEPLAWLANTLAKRGRSLEAGTIIITGSIVAPQFLTEGDEAVVSIDELGEAVLRIT